MNRKSPDDLTCLTCSKPIRPGVAVAFEHGDMFHLTCRNPTASLLKVRTTENVGGAAEFATGE